MRSVLLRLHCRNIALLRDTCLVSFCAMASPVAKSEPSITYFIQTFHELAKMFSAGNPSLVLMNSMHLFPTCTYFFPLGQLLDQLC